MGAHIEYMKLIITIASKTFCFDLPKDAYNYLEHKIDSFIKHNELLAEHTIKKKVRQLLSKYKHKNDIYEPHK